MKIGKITNVTRAIISFLAIIFIGLVGSSAPEEYEVLIGGLIVIIMLVFCIYVALAIIDLGRYLIRKTKGDEHNSLPSAVIAKGDGFKNALTRKSKIKALLKEIMSDDVMTDEESKELYAKAEELGVTKDYVDKLRDKGFKKAIRPIMDEVESTMRFSPEQETELLSIAKKQKVDTFFEGDAFRDFRRLWEIENHGTFDLVPQNNPDIRLTKNEKCYFSAEAVWQQEKTVKKHNGYVGGSVGFRVAKGVTLRVGKAVPSYTETEEIKQISQGTLYLTSKKLVFVGNKKSTNITFGRLANYELFNDAIIINKTSGKPDIFKLSKLDMQLLDAHLQML